MTSVNEIMQQVKSMSMDLKPLEITKTSVGGHAAFTKTSPLSIGSYGTELFSKKKQKFPVHRVYASDIPANITDKQIEEKFSIYGEITELENSEVDEVENYKSVFVTFKNTEDAMDAINSKFGEITFEANVVKICEAVPKKSQIFVGGLKPETDEEDLSAFFSKFGNVCESVLKTDNRTGLSRCFAFVTFVDSNKVVKGLLKDRFIEMYGKRIEVKPAVPMNQQTRMKRAQMAAAYSVASDQVNASQRLSGNGRKSMSMSMSLESPVFNNAMANPGASMPQMMNPMNPNVQVMPASMQQHMQTHHAIQPNPYAIYEHPQQMQSSATPSLYGVPSQVNPYAAYQAQQAQSQAAHQANHFQQRYGY